MQFAHAWPRIDQPAALSLIKGPDDLFTTLSLLKGLLLSPCCQLDTWAAQNAPKLHPQKKIERNVCIHTKMTQLNVQICTRILFPPRHRLSGRQTSASDLSVTVCLTNKMRGKSKLSHVRQQQLGVISPRGEPPPHQCPPAECCSSS